MLSRKNARECGKLSLSKYFQEFADGERVAIVREQSQNPAFPKRIQGKTGEIRGKQGNAYKVLIKDGAAEKVHLIMPVHLRRMK